MNPTANMALFTDTTGCMCHIVTKVTGTCATRCSFRAFIACAVSYWWVTWSTKQIPRPSVTLHGHTVYLDLTTLSTWPQSVPGHSQYLDLATVTTWPHWAYLDLITVSTWAHCAPGQCIPGQCVQYLAAVHTRPQCIPGCSAYQATVRTWLQCIPGHSAYLAAVHTRPQWVPGSVIFVTKIKTRTKIIGLRLHKTRTRIMTIQKTKTK